MSLYDELRECIKGKLESGAALNHTEKMIHDMYYNYVMKPCFDTTDIIDMNKIHTLIQSTLIKYNNYIIKLFLDGTIIYVNYVVLKNVELFHNMLDMYEFDSQCVVEIPINKAIDNNNIIYDIYQFTLNGTYTPKALSYKELYDLVCVIDYMGSITYKNVNILSQVTRNILSNQSTSKQVSSKTNTKILIDDNLDNNSGNNLVTLDMVERLYTIFSQNGITNYSSVLSSFMKNVDEIGDLNELKNKKMFNDILSGCSYADVIIQHKVYDEFVSIYTNDNADQVLECLLYENKWDIIMVLNKNNKIKVSTFLLNHIKHITDLILKYDIEAFTLELRLKLYEKFNKTAPLYASFDDAIIKNNTTFMLKDIPNVLNSYQAGDGDNFRKLTNISSTILFTNNATNMTQLIKFMPLTYKKWTCVGKVLEINNDIIKVKFTLRRHHTVSINSTLLVNYQLHMPYNYCKMTQINTTNKLGVEIINASVSECYVIFNNKVNVNDNIYV